MENKGLQLQSVVFLLSCFLLFSLLNTHHYNLFQELHSPKQELGTCSTVIPYPLAPSYWLSTLCSIFVNLPRPVKQTNAD